MFTRSKESGILEKMGNRASTRPLPPGRPNLKTFPTGLAEVRSVLTASDDAIAGGKVGREESRGRKCPTKHENRERMRWLQGNEATSQVQVLPEDIGMFIMHAYRDG